MSLDTITCQRAQMILDLCDRAWFVHKSLPSSVDLPESLRGGRHIGIGAAPVASHINGDRRNQDGIDARGRIEAGRDRGCRAWADHVV